MIDFSVIFLEIVETFCIISKPDWKLLPCSVWQVWKQVPRTSSLFPTPPILTYCNVSLSQIWLEFYAIPCFTVITSHNRSICQHVYFAHIPNKAIISSHANLHYTYIINSCLYALYIYLYLFIFVLYYALNHIWVIYIIYVSCKGMLIYIIYIYPVPLYDKYIHRVLHTYICGHA